MNPRRPAGSVRDRGDGSDLLRRMLDDGEELRWLGKPRRRRMLLDVPKIAAVVLVPVGMLGVAVAFFVGLAAAALGIDTRPIWGFTPVVVVAVPVGVFFGLLLLARRLHANAEYAVTDERLVKLGGAFGIDASVVDWANVRDLEVSVNALDGLFDTGTVTAVTAGSGGVSFRYVPSPYELVAEFETVRSEARDG